MKKLLLTALAAGAFSAVNAQAILDTVLTGASYANQVWYSLPNDEQGSSPKTNWDIAFDASGFGSTIMINPATGTTLWNYPKSDISGWATVDTSGLSTWTPRYNSDVAWDMGAMGKYADPTNSSDLDWGLYNLTTHIISGDSLYIIKLASGDYKKLAIVSLSGGIYSFKYENLDGTSPQVPTLNKSGYTGKNFGYYSLQTNSAVDREPASANWDVTFTQYTAYIPSPYTVTGVLGNSDVEVAKCAAVVGKDTFVTWKPQPFTANMNGIGYDWKTFTGMGYKVQDSLVYFVARSNGEIWKMIFTGFVGSSTGAYMFSKEKLYTPPLAINNAPVVNFGTAVYPNPASGTQAVTLVYNMQTATSGAKVTVSDVTGRVVLLDDLENTQGLHQYVIPVSNLQAGMYMITVSTTDGTAVQKLIVQ